MKQAFAESADNPSKALDEFAFGSMEERTRLANIMEIDDPEQRVAAHHQYFTEFFANRSIALATTIAGGNSLAQIKNAGMRALDKAIDKVAQSGSEWGAGGGLEYAFETGMVNAATVTNTIAKAGKAAPTLPFAIGAMNMSSNSEGNNTEPSVPFSNEIEYGPATITGEAAKLADQEYVLLTRMQQNLLQIGKNAEVKMPAGTERIIRLADGEFITEHTPETIFRVPDDIKPVTGNTKTQADMANMLLPSVQNARHEAMLNLLKTQNIPHEPALTQLLLAKENNVFNSARQIPISAQAEKNVLSTLLTDAQTRPDIPKESLGKIESNFRLQISFSRSDPAIELKAPSSMATDQAASPPGP